MSIMSLAASLSSIYTRGECFIGLDVKQGSNYVLKVKSLNLSFCGNMALRVL